MMEQAKDHNLNRIHIDLYSDTATLPTPGVREFMAAAEVGDEQKGEDPTTNRLIEKACLLLDKEDAIFLISGTMCRVMLCMSAPTLGVTSS